MVLTPESFHTKIQFNIHAIQIDTNFKIYFAYYLLKTMICYFNPISFYELPNNNKKKYVVK